ncbi:uncharacterized protein [Bemisia tabaci]|uniref:uncharacterized protein n=1 Tax=Bemisia tabaci TaxID=7038 RepID=UPI003B28067F
MLRNSCVLLGAFVCLCVAGGASSSYVNLFQPFESDQEKWAETSDNYEELQQYHHMGDTEIQEDKTAGTFNDDGPSCSLEGIPAPPVDNPVNKSAADSEKPELKPQVEEPTDAKEENMDDDEKNLKAAPVKEEPQLKPAAETEEPQLKSAPVNPRKPPSGTTEGLYAQKNKAESGN